MRLYLAGPMSGIPSFNLPAFDTMAAYLRALNHEVINPAEMDGAETRQIIMASKTGSHDDLPEGETWGFYLSRDVKMLADDGIEGVVVLDGWQKSLGARLETFVARAILGLPVLRFVGRDLLSVPANVLVKAWAGPVWDEMVWPLRAGGS